LQIAEIAEATKAAVESAALAFKRIVDIKPCHYAAILQKIREVDAA
jgi:hypothetical protein